MISFRTHVSRRLISITQLRRLETSWPYAEGSIMLKKIILKALITPLVIVFSKKCQLLLQIVFGINLVLTFLI